MPSKAQGLSLNTIIIAALVLLVLLILVGMTTGFFGKKFGPDFDKLSSTDCKGKVVTESQGCAADERQDYAAQVDKGKMCCINIGCKPWTCAGPGKMFDNTCSVYDDPTCT
ncbi:hypothetical protein HYV83_03905 [Candidatus Woesearchaeota archaeon]|nr:hypothetical protein [Candidatus Woesearchaeota archaeon]